MDLKLEVVTIPVADTDRAKRFYGHLGWRIDADITRGDAFRLVQVTPPGSTCSLHFGRGLTTSAPGSVQRLYLAVSDLEVARAELVDLGVDVSEIFHNDPEGATRQRSRAVAQHLFVVRLVQRSRRQRLAAAGGHRTPARTHSPS